MSFGAVTGLVPRTSQGAPEGIEDCTTIDEPGEYELENDITGGGTLGPDDDACIDIEGVSGVTLDGNDYVLEGDGDGAGIRVSSGEVTIRTLTVRGFEDGFRTELGPRATIRSATIEQNSIGIDGDLSEISCTNSIIRDNDGAGISSFDGVGSIVRDCETRGDGGTPAGDCCRGPVVIEDCTIVGNDGPINLIPVPGTRIERAEIAESGVSGISTSYGDRGNTPDEPVRIVDSYIHHNDGPGINHRNGYFEVRSRTLSGNLDGYRSESALGGGSRTQVHQQ